MGVAKYFRGRVTHCRCRKVWVVLVEVSGVEVGAVDGDRVHEAWRPTRGARLLSEGNQSL